MELLTGRPIQASPQSDSCFSLIQAWIAKCLAEHTFSCPNSSLNLLPTRLVDVGSLNDSLVLALRISEPNETGIWIALSHCWGSGPHFTTTSATLAARRESISYQELPKTFQDAIYVTRMLGCRYIWIDSLCIIQDDTNDWAYESSQMQSYYRNATLTIAVDSAAGDHEGFLHKPRSGSEILARLPIESNACSGQSNEIFIRRMIPKVTTEPLFERAWTLQEDILSPRTVHFTTEQLTWECQQCVISESNLRPKEALEVGYRPRKNYFLIPEADPNGLGVSASKIYERWYNIVSDYISRAMTNQEDRLPAIAGIAREIHKQTSSAYKAGIWMEDLSKGLSWSYKYGGKRPAMYRAPSFSWASLDPVIPHRGTSFDALYAGLIAPRGQMWSVECQDSGESAHLIDCQLVPLDRDPFGRLASGFIKLRGSWLPPIKWSSLLDAQREKGYLEPHVNCYGQRRSSFLRRQRIAKWAQVTNENQVFCTFDEPPDTVDMIKLFFGISFLQIARLQHNNSLKHGRVITALMLKAADSDGNFMRVGIAEFPCRTFSDIDSAGWEKKDISIV